MNAVKPIYIKLLILGIVVYVVSVSIMLSDLYHKVVNIEHALSHTSSEHNHKH